MSASVSWVQLQQITIPSATRNILSYTVAKRQNAIVFYADASTVLVATTNPDNTQFLTLLAKKLGKRLAVYQTSQREIDHALSQYEEDTESWMQHILTQPRPTQQLVYFLLKKALRNAHILVFEPDSTVCRVRFELRPQNIPDIVIEKQLYEDILRHVRLLGSLVADTLATQEGRVRLRIHQSDVDVAIAIAPNGFGSRIMLQLHTAQ